MPRCGMMKSSHCKVECDCSGFHGCPKKRNREIITPECWYLRRLTERDPVTTSTKITRRTLIRCPKCRHKFQAKEGLHE